MLCWLKHIGLNHLNRNWLLKFDTINRLQSTLWIFSHGGSHEEKQGGQFDTVYTFGTHSFFYSSPCHWHFGVLQCVCVCVCLRSPSCTVSCRASCPVVMSRVSSCSALFLHTLTCCSLLTSPWTCASFTTQHTALYHWTPESVRSNHTTPHQIEQDLILCGYL